MFTRIAYICREVIWPDRTVFAVVFVVALFGTHGMFAAAGFVPAPAAVSTVPEPNSTTTVATAESAAESTAEPDDVVGEMLTQTPDPSVPTANVTAAKPVRMYIDALDRTIPIENPTSRQVAVLDAALREGAVRHPDSADFAREGNIFVLGHSSYLPNVLNRNYQIFNGIQNLQWGDTIRVYSEDTEYIYRVDRVYEAKASNATIPIAGTGPRLTLATCDSFGSVDDRFIVEAELQSSQPLDS